jgi:cobalt-precorrin-5B (C1)-methyltransferase
MLGKAVKLAEGHLDTHSRSVVMNREFLKRVAADAGCSQAVEEAIDRLTLARELWTALPPDDARRFFSAILARCRTVCAAVYPPSAGTLEIILLDESGFSLSL